VAHSGRNPGSLNGNHMSALFSLRPALPEDLPFLMTVYASTRAEEMALVPWDADQKRAFAQMQFHAQRQHYSKYYPDAQYLIIQQGQAPIGRLIVNRTPAEILLIDIALLPDRRKAGIGTALIRDLMREALQSGLTLRLHVETFNPAMNLYRRLGFTQVAEMGIYMEMEWKADRIEEGVPDE
jgi:ribosomal protein S18 acetylase RimI-like enzyme